MHIRFQSNLIQEEFRQESQNIDNAATKEFKCIPQYNNLLMYSNKIKGISFASKHNIQENQKQFKEQFTLDPSMIKLQKTSKNAIMSIPTQAIKYGHFVIPDTETSVTKEPHNWPKIVPMKSPEHSSQMTGNSQLSMCADSGRPPTALKKPTTTHAKNSMSTHIKKNSYFHTKADDMQDDLDEFPQQKQRMTDPKNSKQSARQTDGDSSVSKYNEYKKIYFHDAQHKQADPGKQKLDKSNKIKNEHAISGPSAVKFDVLSDRAEAQHYEAKNVVDKIVSKHLKARDTQPVVEVQAA